jgi:hypothetical protein
MSPSRYALQQRGSRKAAPAGKDTLEVIDLPPPEHGGMRASGSRVGARQQTGAGTTRLMTRLSQPHTSHNRQYRCLHSSTFRLHEDALTTIVVVWHTRRARIIDRATQSHTIANLAAWRRGSRPAASRRASLSLYNSQHDTSLDTYVNVRTRAKCEPIRCTLGTGVLRDGVVRSLHRFYLCIGIQNFR